ncbi:MAG: DMT family transporter [Candidatus Edwardsbacteria bacterium]|nr:DMT family transporter [Candidatus Edwardsbacteria bacterium]MBU1575893.1 DMT family transporter [Candidatus Edwardsbacteria bacterium]MBU2464335.1 DMT family transporter [Candidatus Edwardsbacteria bacterium]MBU2593106.1 DMT family transporter [Candidatus Edwardsbacteria bacterium]
MNKSTVNNPLMVLVSVQVIMAGTFLMTKLGLREFSPLALGVLRFGLTALVFAALLGMKKMYFRPDRKDRWTFLWLALFSVPFNQGLFLYGMKYTLAAHGALLYAATPIMVLCLSCIWLKERPSPLKITGIALGFAGVLLVLFEKGIDLSGQTLKGDILIFFAVLTWSVYTILSKKMLQKYRPLQVTGYSLMFGAVLFLPIGLLPILRQDYAAVTWSGLSSILYLALLTSVVGYLTWNWALSKIEASKVAVVSNLQPVFAALLAWIFLGEKITPNFILGAAVVAAGVILTEKG